MRQTYSHWKASAKASSQSIKNQIEKDLVLCACNIIVTADKWHLIVPQLKACWQVNNLKMIEEKMERARVLEDTTKQQNFNNCPSPDLLYVEN